MPTLKHTQLVSEQDKLYTVEVTLVVRGVGWPRNRIATYYSYETRVN